MEKILPRLNPGFDTYPISRSINFARFVLARGSRQMFAEVSDMLAEKYGFYTAPSGQ